MTLPHERLLCLAWGCELLQYVERDDALPAELRQAAKDLRLSHPSPEDLHRLVQTRTAMLSSEHATAIQAARELFESVQRGGDGRAEMLRFVLFTLRHYPDKTLVAAWVRGFYPTIDDWLARDG